MKRQANFGGVGGQYSPFSPGGSPLFRGGPSGQAGYAINNFSGDSSMDDLMGRTRKPDILGFEKPLETMLEIFHKDHEEDSIPYLLTFDERLKLDKKKKIRNKEQYLSDLKKQQEEEEKIKNYSVKKLIEKIHTVEELLEQFRKNNDIDFAKMAQSYYRRPGSLPLLDEFLPSVDEHKENDLANARLTQPWTGPYDPQYENTSGIDHYVQQLQDPQKIDMHAYFDGLMTTNDPTANENHDGHGTLEELPSPITEESKSNAINLEQKLEKLKRSPKNIGRLDPDMFGTLDWDKILRGVYPQRGMTNEGPYRNDGLGGYTTTGYPDTSNNPYFGVIS